MAEKIERKMTKFLLNEKETIERICLVSLIPLLAIIIISVYAPSYVIFLFISDFIIYFILLFTILDDEG
jgi:hypothetical protein